MPPSSQIASHHIISFLPFNSISSDPLRRKSLSFFFPNPPPPRSRCRGKLRVSAVLRHGPNPRRNSLREKLLARDAQVREISKPSENSDLSSPDRDEGIETHSSSSAAGSVLWTKLENWVEQYKEDNEFWGVGTGPIFTVFRDPGGNIIRVSVNEDEIVRRNQIGRLSHRDGEEGDIGTKILRAKVMAEEIVSGEYVIPTSSSVVKYVDGGRELNFVYGIRSAIPRGKAVLKICPRLGLVVFCGYAIFWVVRSLWGGGEREELTSKEKEMLRRKLKARKQSEMVVKGSVEVVQDDTELPMGAIQRPELDKEELMKGLVKAKAVRDVSARPSLPGQSPGHAHGFEHKVKEIREMARKARESERQGLQRRNESEEHDLQLENNSSQPITASSIVEAPEDQESEGSTVDIAKAFRETGGDVNENERITLYASSSREEVRDAFTYELSSSTENFVATKPKIIRSVKEARAYLARKNKRLKEGSFSHQDPVSGRKQVGLGLCKSADIFDESNAEESQNIKRMNEASDHQHLDLLRNSDTKKIDYEFKENSPMETDTGILFRNAPGQPWEPPNTTESGNPSFMSHSDITDKGCTEFQVLNFDAESNDYQSVKETISSQILHIGTVSISCSLDTQIESLDVDSEYPENTKTKDILDEEICIENDLPSAVDSAENVVLEKNDIDNLASHFPPYSDRVPEKSPKSPGLKELNGDDIQLENNNNIASGEEISGHLPDSQNHLSESKQIGKKNWLEENFHEFEPIVEKIGEGFRKNYAMAKEKVQEQNMVNVHINELDLVDGDDEIEWMKDEKLKEIVFKVRENELAGKDPFYLMSADDQRAFFMGLEKKSEKLNTKLSTLHEWIHSRVENIDYGADGISLYDSPEKIMPRWKSPVMDRYPEFLNNSGQIRQAPLASQEKKICTSYDNEEKLKNASDGASPSFSVDDVKKIPQNGANTAPRTIIECSDGSSRAGKKGGKEHWEHTKKWSREFLEIYNAETDPEVKSAMKGMGKDLDKWITDKEVEDVANLMTRIPKKKRKFIQKKLDKLKREMEMFGPQAVVSKYREYSEEKEEDYLWWLDLKSVLCIEIYKVENGSQKVGFYSLEMAPDLELDPKQFHVIAFEDPSDSKNFCYIMQAHLEMIGNGSAFVVARPPKDAFREAKANGFHVTVIRRGELKLNIDQTLEEVEEEIIEIGSKIYHDKIMRERSVDMGGLMKGVFASEGSTKRRRKLSRPSGR